MMDNSSYTTEQAADDRRKPRGEKPTPADDTRRGLPPKLSRLRRKLAEKAKRESGFRFYALYDRIYRLDTLWSAWCLVAANNGAPGVDGVTIQQIKDDDPHAFVEQIQEELRTKTYKPMPIRRKYIPKGGGISPILANAFLHWFDRAFYGANGPASWAKARLVRYADDFVVMAKYIGPRITGWIESVLQDRLGLEINQDKTSVVNVADDGATLDFLGYSFRYDESLYGRGPRYLNRFPSKKSLSKAREEIRALTATRLGGLPVGLVVGRLNRFLVGWSNYFGRGYSRRAFRNINAYVQLRMWRHLRRRSQRSLKPPEAMSWFTFIYKRLGVIQL